MMGNDQLRVSAEDVRERTAGEIQEIDLATLAEVGIASPGAWRKVWYPDDEFISLSFLLEVLRVMLCDAGLNVASRGLAPQTASNSFPCPHI